MTASAGEKREREQHVFLANGFTELLNNGAGRELAGHLTQPPPQCRICNAGGNYSKPLDAVGSLLKEDQTMEDKSIKGLVVNSSEAIFFHC